MRTFFAALARTNGAPVMVEYSFRAGDAPSYTPLSGADGGDHAEVEIVRAWLKSDEDDPAAPDITPTDAEIEAWTDLICETHADEPDGDDWL